MDNSTYYETLDHNVSINPIVIIINGSGGSGKDTFCKYFSKFIPTENVSSVDLVKAAVSILTGDTTKTEEMRTFLSSIKGLWVNYNNGPTLYMLDRVEKCEEPVIFLHIREPEEIEKMKEALYEKGIENVTTLLIKNKNVKEITSNFSDGSVNNYEYDSIIHNDGTKLELLNETLAYAKCIAKLYNINIEDVL